jgi:curved DNA-binding protein CbpA
MTYYEVLGVSENATSTQIRNAYRKLVKQYHPDTNSSPQASEFIKQVNEAYGVLSDSEKRVAYDRRHYQYSEPVVQEDPNETYRQEYLEKRAEKEREQRKEEQRLGELKERFKKQIFGVAKWLAVLSILYACITIVDSVVPGEVYREIPEDGWQIRVSGRRSPKTMYKSFMKTRSFLFSIPNEVHADFEYNFNPEPVSIYVTPILRRINKVELTKKQQFYSWNPRSFYAIVLEYILLISGVIALMIKKYSKLNYYLRLAPILIIFLLIVIALMQYIQRSRF